MSNSQTGVPRVSLGEPLRFRPAAEMRQQLRAHARDLSQAAGHTVSVAGGVRDLLGRALAADVNTFYTSGFREGFLAGYTEGKRQAKDRYGGPIGPPPSDDNGDYRGPDGEGNDE